MDFPNPHRVLALLFVVTGASNVLLIKWSDTLMAECNDGKFRPFQHPVVQTALMFLGEFICFLIYKILHFCLQRRGDGSEQANIITRGAREFSPLSLFLPSFLDAVASVLLFTGLYLTYASSFQMIRGSTVIFVGIFSSIYLNQTLISRHWMAMFTIMCGIIILLSVDMQRVYYDQASLSNADANAVLTGDLLVICACVFHAAQFVYEEKYLKATDLPVMEAVGWQGVFGLAITALLGVAMHFLPTQLPLNANSREVFDDLGDLLTQLRSNPWLPVALGAFVLSCGCYNYVALSIAKFSSTTNRMLADGIRVIFIWLMAALFEWEYLPLGTLLGFIILQMGLIAYRNAIFVEWYRSLLAALARRRYADLTGDPGNVPASRPADVI